MVYKITSILIAAAAGAFYFDGRPGLGILCIVTAFLFSIGYFDTDKEHKKSVK